MLTNVRDYSQVAIGKKWQVTKGSAVTPNLFFRNCAVIPVEDREYLEPQGSDGSKYPLMTGKIETMKFPKCTARYLLSPTLAAFLLESMLQGATAVANGGLTESGDAGDELSTYAFAGIRPYINTDSAGKIYAELSDSGGTRTVNIYKDSGKGGGDLIATGTKVGDGIVTLSESNNSGVTGVVTVAYSDGEALVTLLIQVITYVFAVQPTKYFTFAYDDGIKKVTLTDCLTQSMTLSFGEADSIEVTEEILALKYEKEDSDLTSSGIDVNYFGARHLDLRDDIDDENTQLTLETFDFSMSRNYVAAGKSGGVPSYYINEGYPTMTLSLTGQASDEFSDMHDDGRALNFNDMKATFTRGTANILELLFKNTHFMGEYAGFDPTGPKFELSEVEAKPQSATAAEDAFQPTLKINQS